jgi:hypothetical protein
MWARPDRSPAGHTVRLTSRNTPATRKGANTRARGTPSSRRDSRPSGHRPHQEINPSRTPQASRSHMRKIEASDYDPSFGQPPRDALELP